VSDLEKDWKKAKGIKYQDGMTNSALAPRDYKISCVTNNLICQHEGYHFWWCETHYQPYYRCETEKLKESIPKPDIPFQTMRECSQCKTGLQCIDKLTGNITNRCYGDNLTVDLCKVCKGTHKISTPMTVDELVEWAGKMLRAIDNIIQLPTNIITDTVTYQINFKVVQKKLQEALTLNGCRVERKEKG